MIYVFESEKTNIFVCARLYDLFVQTCAQNISISPQCGCDNGKKSALDSSAIPGILTTISCGELVTVLR